MVLEWLSFDNYSLGCTFNSSGGSRFSLRYLGIVYLTLTSLRMARDAFGPFELPILPPSPPLPWIESNSSMISSPFLRLITSSSLDSEDLYFVTKFEYEGAH